MKERKNLEAVFLAAAVLTTFATYATAEVPLMRAAKAAPAAVVQGKMQVVVIKGHRLSATEKAALN